jgi:aldehyde dehydrogenase (NAD+)
MKRAREEYRTGKTHQLEYRRSQLKQLILLLDNHEDEIIEALHKDLHKVYVIIVFCCFV